MGFAGMLSVTIIVSFGSSTMLSFRWKKKRGITWTEESLKDTECADNVCLLSHRYERMKRKLVYLWEESKKVGLETISLKTKKNMCQYNSKPRT
jgi:hypothetical protein